uniref:Uncharacterized protein n=1 Tax=Arundo donax TaxID=35708 RepID=A0A0A9EIZ1_ARUDO
MSDNNPDATVTLVIVMRLGCTSSSSMVRNNSNPALHSSFSKCPAIIAFHEIQSVMAILSNTFRAATTSPHLAYIVMSAFKTSTSSPNPNRRTCACTSLPILQSGMPPQLRSTQGNV